MFFDVHIFGVVETEVTYFHYTRLIRVINDGTVNTLSTRINLSNNFQLHISEFYDVSLVCYLNLNKVKMGKRAFLQ